RHGRSVAEGVRYERRQGLQPTAQDIERFAQDEAEHDDRRQKEDAAKDRRTHKTRDRLHHSSYRVRVLTLRAIAGPELLQSLIDINPPAIRSRYECLQRPAQ